MRARPDAQRTRALLASRVSSHSLCRLVRWPGFYDFNWITSEVSATPLLDVQAAPGLEHFAGLQQVTIYDYNGADVTMPHYMRSYPALDPASVQCEGKSGQCSGLVGICALNCSGIPDCKLDGLTIIASSGYEGMGYHVPAVRVWSGDVTAVTVFGSQKHVCCTIKSSLKHPIITLRIGKGD